MKLCTVVKLLTGVIVCKILYDTYSTKKMNTISKSTQTDTVENDTESESSIDSEDDEYISISEMLNTNFNDKKLMICSDSVLYTIPEIDSPLRGCYTDIPKMIEEIEIDYSKMDIKELKEIAKRLKLKGYSRMKKETLIFKLNESTFD